MPLFLSLEMLEMGSCKSSGVIRRPVIHFNTLKSFIYDPPSSSSRRLFRLSISFVRPAPFFLFPGWVVWINWSKIVGPVGTSSRGSFSSIGANHRVHYMRIISVYKRNLGSPRCRPSAWQPTQKGGRHYRHRVCLPRLRLVSPVLANSFKFMGGCSGCGCSGSHERELFHSLILFPTICHTLYGREEMEGATTHPIELSNALNECPHLEENERQLLKRRE